MQNSELSKLLYKSICVWDVMKYMNANPQYTKYTDFIFAIRLFAGRDELRQLEKNKKR